MSEEQTLLTQAAAPEVEAPVADSAAPAAVQEVQDWRPETLRGEKALEKYKSPEDAFKALVEAQKLIGKKADPLAPPAEDAPQEEKDAFNAKLRELRGVPSVDKVAEAYAVAAPDDAPEGYEISPDLMGAFQGLALEAGLAPAEFKRMAEGYMQMEIAQINAARAESKANQEKGQAELVKGWQAEGRVPKDEFSNALKAAQILGLVGKDGKDNLLGHLGNSTALVAALANAYPALGEAGLKGGATVSSQPLYTPKEAMDKGRAMLADPRYKDSRKRDPDFVREVDAFFEQHGKLIARR